MFEDISTIVNPVAFLSLAILFAGIFGGLADYFRTSGHCDISDSLRETLAFRWSKTARITNPIFRGLAFVSLVFFVDAPCFTFKATTSSIRRKASKIDRD